MYCIQRKEMRFPFETKDEEKKHLENNTDNDDATAVNFFGQLN